MVTDAAAAVPVDRRMSWEQFLRLPDELRAEYVDGRVYVNPPPSFNHQEICLRLRDVVVGQLGSQVIAAMAVGWLLPGERRRLRIPDLMLLTERPSGDLVTGVPEVVVEVVSTNRNVDLVTKATEYLDAGAGQYWIVDPRDRVIDVFARRNDGWKSLAQLTDDAPQATVPTRFGDVTLDLPEILGTPPDPS